MTKDKILVIDDEAGIRSSLKGILEDEGFAVKTTDTGETGLEILKNENIDLVLLDIWLPQLNGLDVLAKIKASEEDSQVVMISGHGSIATAVKATKLGAYDFLEKPLSLEKVVLTIKNALRQKRLEEENIQLREKVKAKYQLIGESPAIQKLKIEIKLAAPTNGRVLIYGETGTGTERSGPISSSWDCWRPSSSSTSAPNSDSEDGSSPTPRSCRSGARPRPACSTRRSGRAWWWGG